MAKYYLLSDGRKIGIDGSTKSVEDLHKWAKENNIGLSEYYKYETKKGNIINVPRWSVERARALDYPDMQGAVNISDREEKQLSENLFKRVASGELTVKNPLGKAKDLTRTVAEPDALKVARYEPPVKKEEPSKKEKPSLPMYLQEPLNNFQAVEKDIQALSVSRPPDDYPNELAIWKKDWDATVNRAGLYEEQYLSRATGLTKAQREYKEEEKAWAKKYPLLAMLYQLPLGFNSLFSRTASLPHMGNPNADTSHGWDYARSEGMMEGLAEAGQGWSDWGAGFYSLGHYLPMTVATLMAVAAPPTALATAPVIGLTIPQAVTATTLILGAASATSDEWRKMYMNDGFLSTKEQIAGIMKGVIESATEYLGEAFQVKTFYNAYKLGGRAGLDTAVKQAITKSLYPTLAQYAKAGALMEVSELGEELASEIGSIVTDNVVLGIPAPGPEEMKQRLRDIAVQTFYGTILQGGALQALTVSQSAIQARKLNALSDAKLGWSSPKIALDAINQLKELDFTTSRETAIKAAKQLVTKDAAMNPKAKQVVNQAIANVIDATNQYDVLTAQNLYLEEKAVRKEVEELSWRQAQLERGEQTPQAEQRVSDLEYLIEDANTRLETILQKEMENEQQTEILGIMREGNKLEQKARKSNKQALAKLAKTEEYKNATAEEKVAMATKVGQENYKANTLYDKAETKYKDSALYKLRQTAEYKQAEPEAQAQMEEAEFKRIQSAAEAEFKAARDEAISKLQEEQKTPKTASDEATDEIEVIPDVIDQLEAKRAAIRQERQDINKELNEYRKLMDQQGGWLPSVTPEQKKAYHDVKQRQKENSRKLNEIGTEIAKERAAAKKAEREAQKPKKKVDKKDTKKDTAESEDKDGQKDKERTPSNQRQDTKSDEQQRDDRGESAGSGQADRQGGQDEGGEARAEEKPKQRKTYVKTKSGGKTRVFEATRIEGEWIYYVNERGTESRTKRNPRTQTTNDPLVYRKWKTEHANRSRGAQRAAQKRDRRLTMSQKVLNSMPNLAALQGRVFPPGEAGDFKNVFIPGYGPLCRESKNDQEWTYDTIYENSIPTPEGAQASRDADYKPILEAAEKELDRWYDGRQTQDTDYWDDAQKAQEEIEYYEKELDKATTEEERQLIRQKLTELDGRVFDDYTEAEQMEMEEAESDGVELNDQGYPASWDEVGTDTRTKSEALQETLPTIPDKTADDALLGMVKSHILSITRKDRTTTVNFRDGRQLVINHITQEAMMTEAGKTGVMYAGRTQGEKGKNVYKAIVDLVDGLNTGNRTLFHESFHVVWKLFLNSEQISYINKYYRVKGNKGELVRKYVVTRQGTEMALYWTKEQFNALNRERQAEALEEGAAYGFEHWLGSRTDTAPTTMIGKLWQRLADAIRHALVKLNLASQNAKLTDIFHAVASDKLTGQGEQGAETRNMLSNAYHGSGAFFDRFDVQFMGTGEGVQAFGWGIYVTEKKGVARQYADKLGGDGRVTLKINETDYQNDQWYNGDIVSAIYDEHVKNHRDPSTYSYGAIQSLVIRMEKEINDSLLRGQDPYISNPVRVAASYTKRSMESQLNAYDDNQTAERQDTQYEIEALDQVVNTIMDMIDNKMFSAELSKGHNLYTVNVWETRQEDVLEWDGKPTPEQANKIKAEAAKEGKNIGFTKVPVDFQYVGDAFGLITDQLGGADEFRDGDLIYSFDFPYGGTRINVNTGKQINITEEAFAKAFNRLVDKQKLDIANGTGESIYHKLSRHFGSDKAASEFLLRAGIDGIKYPVNALSGGKGEKGYNYVVFDADQIQIKEHTRYKPVPTAAEVAEAERQYAEVEAKYRGTDIWSRPEQQRYTSRRTSINSKRLPAVFTAVKDWVSGTINADIGGGKYDNATEYLSERGVTNHIIDPYNRSDEHNTAAVNAVRGGQADTATVSNTLNVVMEAENRDKIIAQAADAVKQDGVAFFTFHEDAKQEARQTSEDSWQEFRRAETYIPEISRHFADVQRQGGMIIAKDPIKGVPVMANTTAPLKTINGSTIKRYNNNVGKEIGGQVYVHKQYAADIIPQEIYDNAVAVLEGKHQGFEYNTVVYDKKTDAIRFDQSANFDTAREPFAGDYVWVYPNGGTKAGHTESIWHHKWLWVKDNYSGFNVSDSYNWSETWLKSISNPSGSNEIWNKQLRDSGVKNPDIRYKALSKEDVSNLSAYTVQKFSEEIPYATVSLSKSDTRVGRSHYIKFSISNGIKFMRGEIRISDHGVGTYRHFEYIHAWSESDIDEIIDSIKAKTAEIINRETTVTDRWSHTKSGKTVNIDDFDQIVERSDGDYTARRKRDNAIMRLRKGEQTVYTDTMTRYKPVPTAAEVAEAERQYAEVEAKYKGTDAAWQNADKVYAMSKDEFIANTPIGYKYQSELGYEAIAQVKHGVIVLTDAYFDHPADIRKDILYHEIAHNTVTKQVMANPDEFWRLTESGLFGAYNVNKQKWETIKGLAGRNSEEAITEAVSQYRMNPDQFTKKYSPELVSEVKRISEAGMGYNDQWLKAPNGKPTNLNERQWVQVRTQAFKDWFGEWEDVNAWNYPYRSMAVDANGEPLILFHGSAAYPFTKFKKGKVGNLGAGMYFADKKANVMPYARKYGDDNATVYETYLKMRKPFIIEGGDGADTLLRAIYGSDSVYKRRSQKQGNDVFIVTAADLNKIRDKGHDGIIWKHPGGNEYVVWESAQIKSATANVGTFDQSNPDIRYKKLDPILEQALDDLERERFGRPKPATPSRTATSTLPPEEKPEERPQPTTTRPPNQNKSQRPGQNKPPTEAEIDALSERIGRDLGIVPAQVKEKLGRQIIAAWREAEGDVSRLMENAAIRNFGEWVEKNKPEGTNNRDLIWHWEEMLEYAEKAGLSQQQISEMAKSDRFDATAIGINLFQQMNYTGKMLVETEATLSDRSWGTPQERELMERQYGILQAKFDELQAAYTRQASEAGTVLWTRRQNKAQYLENLTRAAQALESKINRGAVELGEMRQELDGLERTISDLEKSFEMLLRVMDGKRYKDITEMNDAELEAERQKQAERLNDLRNQAEHLKYAIEQKVAAMQADKGRQEETQTQMRKMRQSGRKARVIDIVERKPDVHDWFRAAWYNAVLAGPMTHTINMTANIINSVLEDVITLMSNPAAAGPQVAEQMRALFQKDGAFAKAKQELRSPNEFHRKNQVILKGNKLFQGIQFSTKLLGAEDMLAFFPNERGMLKSLAVWESRETGRSVADLMENPTAEMLAQAHYEAKRNTFNQNPEGYVGVLIGAIEKFYSTLDQSGPGGKALGNLIRANFIPFTRVLGNVLNSTIDYTPLGLIRYYAYKSENPDSLLNKQRKNANGQALWKDENGEPIVSPYRMRDAKRQAARVAFGTILGSLLYALTMISDDDDEDKWFISGAGPRDYKKYKQLMLSRWRPYSLHIGKYIIPYKEWPLSGAFSAIGNLHDIQKYDGKNKPQDWLDQTIYAVMGVASSFLDRSFASTAISAITALDRGDPNWVKRSLTGMTTSSLIPYNNMFRFIENVYNRDVYTPETIGQQIWSSTPLMPKKGLPRRVNVFGVYEQKDPVTARLAMSDNVGLVVPDIKKTREIFKLVRKNNLWLSETNKRELRVDRYVGKRGVAEGDKKYIWLDATDTEKIRVLRGTEYVRLLNEGSNYNRIKKYDKNGDKDKLSALLSKLGKEATAYATEEVLNEYRRNDKMQKKYTTYNKSKEEE